MQCHPGILASFRNCFTSWSISTRRLVVCSQQNPRFLFFCMTKVAWSMEKMHYWTTALGWEKTCRDADVWEFSFPNKFVTSPKNTLFISKKSMSHKFQPVDCGFEKLKNNVSLNRIFNFGSLFAGEWPSPRDNLHQCQVLKQTRGNSCLSRWKQLLQKHVQCTSGDTPLLFWRAMIGFFQQSSAILHPRKPQLDSCSTSIQIQYEKHQKCWKIKCWKLQYKTLPPTPKESQKWILKGIQLRGLSPKVAPKKHGKTQLQGLQPNSPTKRIWNSCSFDLPIPPKKQTWPKTNPSLEKPIFSNPQPKKNKKKNNHPLAPE